ncbi:MAG: uncharacterized protein A8A55_1548 [Amphiamblys sp. WSBS2006]|nr:MAG: uncharacterized protein A8A55_1548 [Amphiamblys sp. WSBS2006]
MKRRAPVVAAAALRVSVLVLILLEGTAETIVQSSSVMQSAEYHHRKGNGDSFLRENTAAAALADLLCRLHPFQTVAVFVAAEFLSSCMLYTALEPDTSAFLLFNPMTIHAAVTCSKNLVSFPAVLTAAYHIEALSPLLAMALGLFSSLSVASLGVSAAFLLPDSGWVKGFFPVLSLGAFAGKGSVPEYLRELHAQDTQPVLGPSLFWSLYCSVFQEDIWLFPAVLNFFYFTSVLSCCISLANDRLSLLAAVAGVNALLLPNSDSYVYGTFLQLLVANSTRRQQSSKMALSLFFFAFLFCLLPFFWEKWGVHYENGNILYAVTVAFNACAFVCFTETVSPSASVSHRHSPGNAEK